MKLFEVAARWIPMKVQRRAMSVFLACFVLMWVGYFNAAQAQNKSDGRNTAISMEQLASSAGGSRNARPADKPATADIPTSQPSSHAYLLGAGDVIRISVWKEADLSQTAVVRPDGNISLPLVGEVNVIGKSILEAQDIIRGRLHGLLTNPQVTVIVLEIHSRQVYITGEVGRPGAYPMEGSIRVLQLIARAGGLTQFAHKKDIYILTKSAKRPLHFNYSKVVRGHDSEQNIALMPGDTVVVP